MALRDLTDIIGPLVIPIRGKEYTLPPVSLTDGLKIHAALAEGAQLGATDLQTILLGDTLAELNADMVGADVIDRVFLTALTDFRQGRDSAEDVWEHGVPKAMRQAAKELMEQMILTGAESTTKPPASGSGTTSLKAKASLSRGSKS